MSFRKAVKSQYMDITRKDKCKEKGKNSKLYIASWILTWIMLQFARITTIISASLIVIGESDGFNLLQFALIKFGAIIIGFIVVTVLNRVIEAVEHYCHEYDI